MKPATLAVTLLAFGLGGCKSIDRLTGHERNETSASTVSLLRPIGSGPQVLEEMKVLVAGQSNGVGPTDNVFPVWAPAVSETRQVYLTHSFGSEVFNHEVPTPSRPAIRSAPWVYLGDMLVLRYNRAVHFINVSHGNTSSFEYETHYLHEMLDAVEKHKPSIVIWVQGEKNRGASQIASYESLKYIIEETRKIKPDLIWYVAMNGYAPTTNYQEALTYPTRLAHEQIVSEGIARRGADIDWARCFHREWFEPWTDYAGPEFAREGLLEHAKMWERVL